MKPLDGIRVVDLSRILAGPYCSMLLGDMGAEIIKIESPDHGDDTRGWGPPFIDGESAYFLSINRNKKSLTLNLKAGQGKDILTRLIGLSDVLIENFRPGTLGRLGFGYEQVRAMNPRMVYASISGFGQTGPLAGRPGYDLIAQGEGGIMSVTGFPDGPPTKAGTPIADIAAGIFAAQGILLALYARERTGRGQLVDVSMLDGQVALLTFQAGIYFATGESPGRMGNQHPTIVPYETFRSKDGYINLAIGNTNLWRTFCKAIGREELPADPRFGTESSRVENRNALKPIMDAIVAERTTRQWLELLEKAGVPAGSVNSVAEICEHPQIKAREMVVDVPHPTLGSIKVSGVPIKLSDTPGAVSTAPPLLGQHTAEILTGLLGCSSEEVEELRKAGTV
jgi:crotonobetainyl-CoA:carnitine CoA-transferase CaiB-like acyl-CoA transferase